MSQDNTTVRTDLYCAMVPHEENILLVKSFVQPKGTDVIPIRIGDLIINDDGIIVRILKEDTGLGGVGRRGH